MTSVCYKHNIIVCGLNKHNTIVSFHAKMTKTMTKLKDIVRNAVWVKKDRQTLSIMAVIRGVKFTNEEVEDSTLQAQADRMVSSLI